MKEPETIWQPVLDPKPDARGPRDDFYCWKFRVWYPSEDCIYRHTYRTYEACGGCFQGRLNLRHSEKGLAPPIIIPSRDRDGA